MAFASSLFCSSKFLEHTHTLTKRLTVLACSDNTNTRTYVPLPFSIFFIHQRVDFFFMSKILVGHIEGGAKKKSVCQRVSVSRVFSEGTKTAGRPGSVVGKFILPPPCALSTMKN